MIEEVDVEDYKQGVRDLQFSVMVKLRLHREQTYPTNMCLKLQLEEEWGFKEFKIVALKGIVFHVILQTIEN